MRVARPGRLARAGTLQACLDTVGTDARLLNFRPCRNADDGLAALNVRDVCTVKCQA